MYKYGKSSAGVLSLKKSFFKENNKKLAEAKRHSEIYKKQPDRKRCKVCESIIEKADFVKLNVEYSLCENCGQLNGFYDDTDEYNEAIYTNSGGQEYARNYYEQNIEQYDQRVLHIYEPKVDFMIESLNQENIDVKQQKYLDLGAGSGYFVKALLNRGIEKIEGYEVSEFQVNYANEMLQGNYLNQNNPHQLVEIIENSDASIVSLIGVMEHLQNPLEVLKAIKNNSNIKYLYFCVPMFSFSVFIETVFEQEVMPRHLTGGHTHLFTDQSLNYLIDKYSFSKVSEWWFGSDFMDLYRSFYVQLNDNDRTLQKWQNYFSSEIDDLQLVLDKKHKSSQVHMLWRVD